MNKNDKVEKRIIGNLMLDEFLDDSIITEHMFYYRELSELFVSIKNAKLNSKPLESVYMENESKLDLISNCTDLGIVTTNYNHNCDILKQLYAARLISRVALEVSNIGYKDCMSAVQKMTDVSSQVEYLTSNNDIRVLDTNRVQFTYGNKKGYVPTGFPSLDECLNDLEPSRVTLVTGKRYQGKTTFVRQVIANAINTNNKVLWMMGENETEDEVRRLYQIVIGNDKTAYTVVKDNKKYIKLPNEKYTKALKKWSSGKLRILHKSEAKLKNHKEMFSLVEKEVVNNKHNLIVIDNLMSMLTVSGIDKNEAQANFMQKCCDIAKLHKTHIILVLHPRKRDDGKDPEDDDISGSADLPNKADNVIWVRKASDEDKAKGIGGYITVTKNKRWGVEINMPTYFKRETETLEEIKDGNVIENIYDIRKYIDTEVVYYNGQEQIFEQGELF